MRMKAQVSIDFVITLAILMVLFLFLFEVALDREAFNRKEIARFQAETKANELARLINSVYQGGDGIVIQRNFYQSLKNGRNYTMTIQAEYNRVEIMWDGSSYFAPIQTNDVVAGDVNGSVSIRNEGGVVYVE